MKKTIKKFFLLLALAVAGIMQSHAQVSKNIVDSTKVWHDGLIYPGGISTFTFQFGEDTIYNDRTYKQLIASSHYYVSYSLLFREDSNRVYFVNLGWKDSKEYLIYDFNLEVGDTVTIRGLTQISFWEDTFYEVKSTDTIIINGTPLKHLILIDKYNRELEWIEGIGSLSGLLHRDGSWVDGATHELLCFSQDGEVLYQSYTAKQYNECFIEAALDEIDNYDVSIFPNPTENKVYITTPRPMFVIISNTEGRKLFRKNLNTSDTLDLTNLKSGVYILTFSDGIKKFSKTFIKK
ncbi:MAG: T9SS type A sorting domain-containing protein [Bacteroidales bacterium]|nr:T9SS type A sorting domain-containing protein [Bacteroidales bacterium]